MSHSQTKINEKITNNNGIDKEHPFANCALLLGGNIGDRADFINKAIDLISERIGEVRTRSKFYESEAWGFECDDKFLNMAIVVNTALSPFQLLSSIKEIEKELGRVKRKKEEYESRVIDIDIIFYDNIVLVSDELTIPHCLMHERQFVIDPMKEVCPDYIHPILNRKVSEL